MSDNIVASDRPLPSYHGELSDAQKTFLVELRKHGLPDEAVFESWPDHWRKGVPTLPSDLWPPRASDKCGGGAVFGSSDALRGGAIYCKSWTCFNCGRSKANKNLRKMRFHLGGMWWWGMKVWVTTIPEDWSDTQQASFNRMVSRKRGAGIMVERAIFKRSDTDGQLLVATHPLESGELEGNIMEPVEAYELIREDWLRMPGSLAPDYGNGKAWSSWPPSGWWKIHDRGEVTHWDVGRAMESILGEHIDRDLRTGEWVRPDHVSETEWSELLRSAEVLAVHRKSQS